MPINPAKLFKTKRKRRCKSNPPFLETMIFEIDNTSTTVATTGVTSTTTTTTKKKSSISRQIFIHPPSASPIPSPTSSSGSLKKRLPFLQKRSHSSSTNSSVSSGRFAELAGGTAAECAAICCCCPCGLANLLYLTIYKVPAGLCRRALRRKRKKQLIKEGLLAGRAKRCRCGCDDQSETHIHPAAGILESTAEMVKFKDEEEDTDDEEEEDPMVKLEKEMWETFCSTGFWRSPSQKETPTTLVIKESSNMAKVKPL